eukprot:3734077-Pyramimonas_sp.AAC.1
MLAVTTPRRDGAESTSWGGGWTTGDKKRQRESQEYPSPFCVLVASCLAEGMSDEAKAASALAP